MGWKEKYGHCLKSTNAETLSSRQWVSQMQSHYFSDGHCIYMRYIEVLQCTIIVSKAHWLTRKMEDVFTNKVLLEAFLL